MKKINQIKLSICIPTYKRPQYIKENITTIAKQLGSNNNLVEFIISDNHSEDTTRDTIMELKEMFSLNLSFFYQDPPIYFEDNFDYVADRAKGEYIYLMGDDDIVSPDFIRVFLRLIEKGYEFIHFNKLVGDANCTNNTLSHKDFEDLEKCYNAKDFIKELLWRPNFMSSIIFSRKIWQTGGSYNLDQMYGYRFLGRVYLGAVALNSKCCYYYMPMLLMRNPQRAWAIRYPLYWFVGMSNIFKTLDKDIPGIYNIWCEYIHNQKQLHFVQNLSAVRLDKALYRNKRDEFMPHLNNLQRFTYDFHLSVFSCKITRGIYYTLLKVFYKE